jgi:hypothetical protein
LNITNTDTYTDIYHDTYLTSDVDQTLPTCDPIIVMGVESMNSTPMPKAVQSVDLEYRIWILEHGHIGPGRARHKQLTNKPNDIDLLTRGLINMDGAPFLRIILHIVDLFVLFLSFFCIFLLTLYCGCSTIKT